MALNIQEAVPLDDKEFDLLFSSAPTMLSSVSLLKDDQIQHFEHFINEEPKPKAKCWELDYYKPYFDLDSATVFLRLKKTLLSQSDIFEGGQPDLYCPFWIVTTLIFIIGVSSNAGLLTKDDAWTPQISKVMTAATFLYSLTSLAPFGCYCLLQHAGLSPKLVSIGSLYAYSYFVFIPALLICILDLFLLRLGVLIAATVWALLLIFRNFWSDVKDLPQTYKWVAVGFLAGGHVFFSLVCLVHFLESA